MLPRSKVWTPDSTKQYLLWYQFLFGKKFVFDIISTLTLLPFPPLTSFTSTTCLTSSTTQVKSYYLQGVPKMSLSEFVVIAAWAACFWCFSFYDKYSNSNLAKHTEIGIENSIAPFECASSLWPVEVISYGDFKLTKFEHLVNVGLEENNIYHKGVR